jgi:hypothetical protein
MTTRRVFPLSKAVFEWEQRWVPPYPTIAIMRVSTMKIGRERVTTISAFDGEGRELLPPSDGTVIRHS